MTKVEAVVFVALILPHQNGTSSATAAIDAIIWPGKSGIPCSRRASQPAHWQLAIGKPKGTAISRGALGNLVAWHERAYDLGPDDRTTLLAAPGFDAAVWEI